MALALLLILTLSSAAWASFDFYFSGSPTSYRIDDHSISILHNGIEVWQEINGNNEPIVHLHAQKLDPAKGLSPYPPSRSYKSSKAKEQLLLVLTQHYLLIGLPDGTTVRVDRATALNKDWNLNGGPQAFLIDNRAIAVGDADSIQSIIYLERPRSVYMLEPQERIKTKHIYDWFFEAHWQIQHEWLDVLTPGSDSFRREMTPHPAIGKPENAPAISNLEESTAIDMPVAIHLQKIKAWPDDYFVLSLTNGFIALVREATDNDLVNGNSNAKIFNDGIASYVVAAILNQPREFKFSNDPTLQNALSSLGPLYETASGQPSKMPIVEVENLHHNGQDITRLTWQYGQGRSHGYEFRLNAKGKKVIRTLPVNNPSSSDNTHSIEPILCHSFFAT